MKFSVITPCLNRVELITATIQSVTAQDYPDFEHWIIDGGSTDGTLELLKGYQHLKVVSEPDRGVYDAINKGIRLATGEIIILLNSDDLLVAGALSLSAEIFRNAVGTMIVSAGCQIFRCASDGTEVEMHRYDNPRRNKLVILILLIRSLPIVTFSFEPRCAGYRMRRFRRYFIDTVGMPVL